MASCDYIYKLDDTTTYCQLIIKITISEKRRRTKLWKKGKFALKDRQRRRKLFHVALELTTMKMTVIGWFKLKLWMWLAYLNSAITNCPKTTWQGENRRFFKTNHNQRHCNFFKWLTMLLFKNVFLPWTCELRFQS